MLALWHVPDVESDRWLTLLISGLIWVKLICPISRSANKKKKWLPFVSCHYYNYSLISILCIIHLHYTDPPFKHQSLPLSTCKPHNFFSSHKFMHPAIAIPIPSLTLTHPILNSRLVFGTPSLTETNVLT